MLKTVFSKTIMLLMLGFCVAVTSCKKDDDPDIGGPTDGIQVPDGVYMKNGDNDPTFNLALGAEKVEGPDFGAIDRNGYASAIMHLDAGNYTFVQVVNKEITTTWGGSATEVMDAESSCGHDSYWLVNLEADGPAFNVAESGAYKVAFDQMRSEMVLHKMVDMSLIGDATPGGWGADTPMTMSTSDGSTTWSINDIVLREGSYKIRYNCRWKIDRRDDPNAGYDESNGYVIFTNYGGAAGTLEPGGSNFAMTKEAEGTYNVSFTLDDTDGVAVGLTRTGDAPEIAFDPAEHRWAIIGDATANAWDADRNLYYKGLVNDAHTWLGVITFAETGAYKFRINDEWNLDVGVEDGTSLSTDGSDVTLKKGGSNIPSPGAGSYYVTLRTADEGDTWVATMVSGGWGLIGAGSPQGNWDADMDMTAAGFDAGITTYTLTGEFVGGEWKFRAGDGWDYNLGGDLSGLVADGGNINTEAGTKTVTLSFDGENYSATVE